MGTGTDLGDAEEDKAEADAAEAAPEEEDLGLQAGRTGRDVDEVRRRVADAAARVIRPSATTRANTMDKVVSLTRSSRAS